MRGGGPFRGRSSNGLQRKRDALFPQLPERRKMTELLSWAVGHGSRRPCSLQWSAGKRFSPAPPFQNFFLIGMGGPRRRIMAGDIGRRTWSMAVPPAARLLWSPACREPWPSCLPRQAGSPGTPRTKKDAAWRLFLCVPKPVWRKMGACGEGTPFSRRRKGSLPHKKHNLRAAAPRVGPDARGPSPPKT